MKYIFIVLNFLLAVYLFFTLNFFDNRWHYIQPMLISTLLIYFNTESPWVRYVYALAAGLLLDSLSPVFGLQAIIFITIIFSLSLLQLTVFTSRNMFSIMALTALAFILFWFLFYLINTILQYSYYDLFQLDIEYWVLSMLINIFLVSFLHIFYFNLWSKKYEG